MSPGCQTIKTAARINSYHPRSSRTVKPMMSPGAVLCAVRCLSKADIAVELDLQLDPRDLQRHLGGKRFRALDGPCGGGSGHGVLDLALRADADRLEEL